MSKKKEKAKTWTRFMDMHSGGGTKLYLNDKGEHRGGSNYHRPKGEFRPIEYIYIEAPEKEAVTIFYNRFGRNPNAVTCTCCGSDYSYEDYESLEQATAFDRNCDYDDNGYVERPRKSDYVTYKHIKINDYLKSPEVHVIYAKDIKPAERIGTPRTHGYVWCE